MSDAWSTLKDVFYTLGSIAGALALLRPLAESKMQRDASRIERIKLLVDEQQLVDLESCITNREVARQLFVPFDQIAHEIRTNQDGIRFSGPSAKYLTKELNALVDHYHKLREYIQVPEWEPENFDVDGIKYETWRFNKRAFEDENRIPKNYGEHIHATEIQAAEMLKAFQRFQLVSELHLFEIPLARWLLARRFRVRNLTSPKAQ
jgi:hypothetical protein